MSGEATLALAGNARPGADPRGEALQARNDEGRQIVETLARKEGDGWRGRQRETLHGTAPTGTAGTAGLA